MWATREDSKMHITLLKGDKNTGKTTALNSVYDDLTKQGWSMGLPKKQIGPAGGNDFVATLTKDKKQIAFFTAGDFAIYIVVAIDIISCLDVDNLVIACRTDRFGKWFESKAEIGSPEDVLQKFSHTIIPSDINNLNAVSQQILADISKHIGGKR
jgi:hypothetical protein